MDHLIKSTASAIGEPTRVIGWLLASIKQLATRLGPLLLPDHYVSAIHKTSAPTITTSYAYHLVTLHLTTVLLPPDPALRLSTDLRPKAAQRLPRVATASQLFHDERLPGLRKPGHPSPAIDTHPSTTTEQLHSTTDAIDGCSRWWIGQLAVQSSTTDSLAEPEQRAPAGLLVVVVSGL